MNIHDAFRLDIYREFGDLIHGTTLKLTENGKYSGITISNALSSAHGITTSQKTNSAMAFHTETQDLHILELSSTVWPRYSAHNNISNGHVT